MQRWCPPRHPAPITAPFGKSRVGQRLDPSIETHGLDEFEAEVHNAQAGLLGAEYSRTIGVDSHDGLHRYSWQISRDSEIVVTGFDVTEVEGEGKVTRVVGFFGPLPDTD
jgi:hypothetical protein